MQNTHVDVIIVGAGLSGVGAAYHLQQKCPGKTYAILEGRERLGGTWDLFRYPGIRSDSDMYTLGYSFRPWTDPKAIADGPSILKYVQDTAEEAGIDRHIRFQRKVKRAEFSSETAQWTVHVENGATGKSEAFTCGFLFMCSGYYDYEKGHDPEFAGRDTFRGKIVHPQFWPEDLDYSGKRVVVIGSGATAVTLVPEIAKKAAHVTMLQRSPTYIVSAPEKDKIANWLREKIPGKRAYSIARWKNVLLSMAFFNYARRFPDHAKRLLVGQAEKQLRGATDIGNFTPSYKPWDQRLCLVPDGDLFHAIKGGRASVVTDHIERFTEKGILLRSGETLDADVIVTATGLSLKAMGGVELWVDGQKIQAPHTMTYKGIMCSDVPNMAFSIGYTNASWTLKCDLTCEFVCRLLNHMDAHGFATCCPRRNDPTVEEMPLMDFTSGYVQRAIDQFPRQGNKAPWRLYQNYVLDRAVLRHAPLDDGSMEFRRAPSRASEGVRQAPAAPR